MGHTKNKKFKKATPCISKKPFKLKIVFFCKYLFNIFVQGILSG